MEKKKRKSPVAPVTSAYQDEIIRIYKLSPKTVARLTAMVESTPGLHDSSAKIIRDHRRKSLAAGS